jgi:hypothetical protein
MPPNIYAYHHKQHLAEPAQFRGTYGQYHNQHRTS